MFGSVGGLVLVTRASHTSDSDAPDHRAVRINFAQFHRLRVRNKLESGEQLPDRARKWALLYEDYFCGRVSPGSQGRPSGLAQAGSVLIPRCASRHQPGREGRKAPSTIKTECQSADLLMVNYCEQVVHSRYISWDSSPWPANGRRAHRPAGTVVGPVTRGRDI